jgi:hypothetical protein
VHCVDAIDRSINIDSYTSKAQIITIFDLYRIPYRVGRATKNNPAAERDSLDELKQELKIWLKYNADIKGLLVGKLKMDMLCETNGHYPPW